MARKNVNARERLTGPEWEAWSSEAATLARALGQEDTRPERLEDFGLTHPTWNGSQD